MSRMMEILGRPIYADIVECENDCRCSDEFAGRFRIGAIGIRRGVGAPTICEIKSSFQVFLLQEYLLR